MLDEWREHGSEILENVERRSGEFLSRLLTMPWQQEAEIRMKGLAITVKLDEDYVSKITDRCRDRGLIVGDDQDQLLIFPALTISEDDTREALDILEHAVSA